MAQPTAETNKPAAAAAVFGLAALGHSKSKIGKVTGLHRNTVAKILERNPAATAAAQKHVAVKFLERSEQALDGITAAKIKASSAAQLMVVAGIGAQRHLELMSGAPAGVTINVAVLQGALHRLEADRNAIAAIKATLPATDQAADDQQTTGQQ
jgi:hypothetical protein